MISANPEDKALIPAIDRRSVNNSVIPVIGDRRLDIPRYYVEYQRSVDYDGKLRTGLFYSKFIKAFVQTLVSYKFTIFYLMRMGDKRVLWDRRVIVAKSCNNGS